jgi:site-specific DNA-cytosine methylase
MQHDSLYPLVDLFTGLAGFSKASESTGRFKTILTSEIDPFCIKLLDQKFGYENAGSITDFAVTGDNHSSTAYALNDEVACEHTGFTTVLLEDFNEGVLEMPFAVTGGFPCQNVTSANRFATDITGTESSLVNEQLRIIEELEPELCIFENSDRLISRGLGYIMSELDRMGYIVEWETITAASFGYPHYRHRLYIVAYLPISKISQSGCRVFDVVRSMVPDTPVWKMPLNTRCNADAVLGLAVAPQPRDIHLRTKRINALGNSVVFDIVKAIFEAVILMIDSKAFPDHSTGNASFEFAKLTDDKWVKPSLDLFFDSTEITTFPTRGHSYNGAAHAPLNPCRKLNPTRTAFSNLFSTLIKKDGNNNFTCKSRLTRPGKLGGLVGDLMHLGADVGGLHPNFGEAFMGYEKDYTKLPV